MARTIRNYGNTQLRNVQDGRATARYDNDAEMSEFVKEMKESFRSLFSEAMTEVTDNLSRTMVETDKNRREAERNRQMIEGNTQDIKSIKRALRLIGLMVVLGVIAAFFLMKMKYML